MTDAGLAFSRALAIAVGIITLLSEVVRRRGQLLDPAAVPLWFDDMVLGGVLLYAAWRTGSHDATRRPLLAAAWGFMCGMAFYSFLGHLQLLAQPDAPGLAPMWVAGVKAVALLVGIIGLATAMRTSNSGR